MSYDGVVVANGGREAGLESLVGGLGQVERGKIKKALLEYCGQDTMALVRLLEELRSSVPRS